MIMTFLHTILYILLIIILAAIAIICVTIACVVVKVVVYDPKKGDSSVEQRTNKNV